MVFNVHQASTSTLDVGDYIPHLEWAFVSLHDTPVCQFCRHCTMQTKNSETCKMQNQYYTQIRGHGQHNSGNQSEFSVWVNSMGHIQSIESWSESGSIPVIVTPQLYIILSLITTRQSHMVSDYDVSCGVTITGATVRPRSNKCDMKLKQWSILSSAVTSLWLNPKLFSN